MSEPASTTLAVEPPAMTNCFDADHHAADGPLLLEVLPGYVDPGFRARGWRAVDVEGGRRALAVGDLKALFDLETHPVPGSFRENILRMRRGEDIDPFQGQLGPVKPEFVDRDARLAFMDTQGIHACLLFPGSPLEMRWMTEEPDLAQLYANTRAINRMARDHWGWGYRDRIYSAAMLPLDDLDLGLEELDRVMAEGCKVVNLVPGPIRGKSPADPCFDRFWARVNESKLLISFHTAPASHTAYRNMLEGFWEPIDPPGVKLGLTGISSAFMGFQMFNERPIMDTVVALIMHNLFGRFPDVKVISVENGGFWVAYTIKLMNKNYAINQNGFWLGGKPERPSAVFREHIRVAPFHEDDIQQLVDIVGADAITFGSDYPHPEGLASPVSEFLEDIEVTSPATIEKIMRENLKGLLDRVLT